MDTTLLMVVMMHLVDNQRFLEARSNILTLQAVRLSNYPWSRVSHDLKSKLQGSLLVVMK